MPDFVRGVINLRGSVVPVVDLAVKLGLPAASVSRWSCIVIVEVTIDGEDTVVGLLVDAMGQVIQLTPADIEKPPSFGTRVRADCIAGMGKVANKFVIILDMDKVLGQADVLAPPAVYAAPVEAGGDGGEQGEATTQ
jgi:purine-binding chemotaxis protein CheW